MFYNKIVPLNRDTHRDFKLYLQPDRFGFAAAAHMIPAVVDEFIAAAPHLPIVFMVSANGPVPVFLVGLRSGQNVMVDADGRWHGDYIPAYVRRYPFMFGEMEGRDSVACIDEDTDLLRRPDGERLFSEDGQETAALLNGIRLMNDYFQAAKRNDSFVRTLTELTLFRTVSIDARLETGESISLQGLLAVDPEKFDALSDESFLRLRKEGFLGPIYAHLASLSSVERVRKRL